MEKIIKGKLSIDMRRQSTNNEEKKYVQRYYDVYSNDRNEEQKI